MRNTDGRDLLLARIFALSASLYIRCDRTWISSRYAIVEQNEKVRTSLFERYMLNPKSIELNGLENLRNIRSDTSYPGQIFAVTTAGPYLLAAAAIGFQRIKIAVGFWQMSATHKKILAFSGVELVNFRNANNTTSIMNVITDLQREGYNIFLLIESPMRSRRRYTFFGYSVTCSSLIELLSRKYDWNINFVCCSAEPSRVINLAISDIETHSNITQSLLRRCENTALTSVDQYIWSPGSIVFSDPRAFKNGLTFLREVLVWRDGIG